MLLERISLVAHVRRASSTELTVRCRANGAYIDPTGKGPERKRTRAILSVI